MNMKDMGLISEHAFKIDGDRWVIERRWNLDHPHCPMVRSPYHSQLASNKNIYVEQRIVPDEYYRELYGTRGHPTERDRENLQ